MPHLVEQIRQTVLLESLGLVPSEPTQSSNQDPYHASKRMKYQQHLKENISPKFGEENYLAYGALDDIIRKLSTKAFVTDTDTEKRTVSMSATATVASGGTSDVITDETFFRKMDAELAKVEQFTLTQVNKLREEIDVIEQTLKSSADVHQSAAADRGKIQTMVDSMAEEFLHLEKYVNLNFMGFHKILKKHDKYVPSNPCKAFYVSRMHAQAWVRGDYSDVVVRLSDIYATLRGDHAAEDQGGDSQSFLRQTSKYWIKTEDVSAVKYAVLKHLPVFLQKTSTGESDAQLTNSVYLDNDQLELYHGRLDKKQGAIALRLRWYATGEPNGLVFVERKTHRDKWTGETSAKERFIVHASEVPSVLDGTYPIAQKKKEMIEKRGASQEEANDWETLVSEIIQVIQTKQLVPTMRTQCMRTAFQIPFDATVRVSLDTNLCMISERGYDIKGGKVWHRDSTKTLDYTEITRFPHAILEVKLELKGDSLVAPQWVSDLQNSGMLYEVHKYSKFTHGCAVLLPEEVRCVPYWIDDVSIRESIIASGGGRILARADLTDEEKEKTRKAGVGPGANEVYNHLLPFGHVYDDRSKTAVGRTAQSVAASSGNLDTFKDPKYGVLNQAFGDAYGDDGGDIDIQFGDDDDDCCSWFFPFCTKSNNAYAMPVMAPTRLQKVEPKISFANERVFMHWLHNGVMLYTIASGILAFASQEGENWAVWYAMALLPIALAFCIYAMHVFLWRAERIKTRIPGRWDDVRGPIVIGGTLVAVLSINFCCRLYVIAKYNSIQSDL